MLSERELEEITKNMARSDAIYKKEMVPYLAVGVWDGATREGVSVPAEYMLQAKSLIRQKVNVENINQTALLQVALQLWEGVRYKPWDRIKRDGRVTYEEIDLLLVHDWIKELNLPLWVLGEIVLMERALGYLPRIFSNVKEPVEPV
ncbi:MAG: hypothetical protein WC575_00570 [Patescibacteria group bacterium]